MEVFHGSLDSHPISLEANSHEIELDKFNQSGTIRIPTSFKEGHILHYFTFTDGHTRILRFADNLIEGPDPEDEILQRQLVFKVIIYIIYIATRNWCIPGVSI